VTRIRANPSWPFAPTVCRRYHLDGSVAISSGTAQFIEASTGWAVEKFNLAGGAAVLDLGCGPGLYTQRLARAGANVTGVDFSSRSIAYARDAAARDGLKVDYVNGDYLTWESEGRFALIMMIMRDYCALAPAQRLALAGKVAHLLEPGGAFLFDVDSMVALEKFAIVEADRTRTIYNWVQHFSPESLAAELDHAGLEVETVLGDVAGRPYDPRSSEFAVIARRRSGR
jgi:SAM-dependent methyltransferase